MIWLWLKNIHFIWIINGLSWSNFHNYILNNSKNVEYCSTHKLELISAAFCSDRCPPVLDIVLRVLSAYLQASRVYLHNHMLSNPIMDNAAQAERERQDLKSALIAAQESAIIQILLECCVPTDEEQREVNTVISPVSLSKKILLALNHN